MVESCRWRTGGLKRSMEAYKKTALTLYSLNDADRRWLLGNIHEHQRDRLMPMLEELETLGIPRRQELMPLIDAPDKDASAPEPPPETAEKTLPEPIAQLLNAPLEKLHHLLKAETPALNAAVFLAHDWPWRSSVLKRFGDAERETIEAHMARMEGMLTEKVSAAILTVLAEKVAQCPEEIPEEEAHTSDKRECSRRWRLFRRWSWRR